ncbi:MAG: polysaccharide deacetylase family protein [Syntrophorhabdaceae bacterium]|nr:polysaccharide deacetylase family protein [Syntrophorhabdaceae bacterium]
MDVTRREFLRLAGGAITASAFIVSPTAGGEVIKIPVLMYHDISNSFNDPYTVSPSLFAAQMEWFYNNGFRTISVRDIANPPAGGKLVVITFDDGYASFLDYAFPLLREYGFCANINIIGNLVGKYIPEGDDSRPMLSWDEYRHLLKSGLVDIGCHTHALHRFEHKGALDVSDDVLRQDLRMFLDTMKKETGAQTDILAWPYGLYDAQKTEVAKKEGFRYIQTSRHGVFDTSGDISEIPRKNISNRYNLAVLRAEVTT